MSVDHVRWATSDGGGLEHCAIRRSGEGALVEGWWSGGQGEVPYGASYRVLCDRRWRTREVRLAYAGSFEMHVAADEEGRWFDRARGDAPLPELEGRLDVDIGVTPFANTLPIKRLGLGEGQSQAIRAAYVPLPSQVEGDRLLPRPADQRYTCLIPDRLYRYEGLFRRFTAELEVDERGLVLDYPDTFRRVPS